MWFFHLVPLDVFTKDVWNNFTGGFWCQNSKATVADEVPMNSVRPGWNAVNLCEINQHCPWQSHQRHQRPSIQWYAGIKSIKSPQVIRIIIGLGLDLFIGPLIDPY